jgi:hypothetical protein
MLVLCYGIPKSGSTLAYEIVRSMLQDAGYDQPVFWNDRRDPADPQRGQKRNFVGHLSKEKISGVLAEIGPTRRIAMKTHAGFNAELFPWLEHLQERRDLQVIASYRDPRDICLSLMDQAQRSRQRGGRAFTGVADMCDAQANVEQRLEQFRKWASLHGTLRLDYDMVAFSPDRAIDAIEGALGVSCDRERVKQYAFTEADTLKKKGKPRRHESELSPLEKEEMSHRFREFLRHVCEADDQAWFEKYREDILSRCRG